MLDYTLLPEVGVAPSEAVSAVESAVDTSVVGSNWGGPSGVSDRGSPSGGTEGGSVWPGSVVNHFDSCFLYIFYNLKGFRLYIGDFF